jgi:hypothetical protein
VEKSAQVPKVCRAAGTLRIASLIGQCSIVEHSRGSQNDSLSPVATRPEKRNIVGRRVAEARNTRKSLLTQDALSGRLARLGVQLDRAAIAKIENNHRRVLDYELKALAKALSVEVTWLLGDKP